MSTRLKKTRKLRGHVSHGHGRVGKHRKHPGGRGKAGGLTHHRTYFENFHPDFFGKKGMNNYHITSGDRYCPAIEVGKIWSCVEKAGEFGKYKNDTSIAPVINMLDFGFFKVVGGGSLKRPIVVKARSFSESAEKAITGAGGKCILVA